jgi:hypothetical protein
MTGAVVGLMTLLVALVLGLLIWTAYGVFSTQKASVQTLAITDLKLDEARLCHFSIEDAIDPALSAIWCDRAPNWADTETIANASIHTITIVAKAIVNGRAFRSSIMRSSYRPLLPRFRNIVASPWPPSFLPQAPVHLMFRVNHNSSWEDVTQITLRDQRAASRWCAARSERRFDFAT